MGSRCLGLCLLVVVAGCVSPFPADRQSQGRPTTPETTAVTATPDSTVTQSNGSQTVVHPGGRAEVLVYVVTEQPVRITVRELGAGGRGVVVDEIYVDRSTVTFGDDGGLVREGRDYRFTIRVNGTRRWRGRVNSHEYYELRVGENGSVDVMAHATV